MSQFAVKTGGPRGPAGMDRKMIEIALYQPDIAPNAATILRMCACFGLTCRIIEPAGFVMSDSQFRRAGMDDLDKPALVTDAS